MKTAPFLLALALLPATAEARAHDLAATAATGDLDLKSEGGRHALEARLHGSARDLCRRTSGRCVSRAVARGYMNVALSAIDTRAEVTETEIATR